MGLGGGFRPSSRVLEAWEVGNGHESAVGPMLEESCIRQRQGGTRTRRFLDSCRASGAAGLRGQLDQGLGEGEGGRRTPWQPLGSSPRGSLNFGTGSRPGTAPRT